MNNSLGILQKLKFSRNEVTSCDISANYLMAVGLSDSTVRVLEWKPGLGFVDKFYSPLHYHKHKITSVRFSPKGVMLAFSSLDGTATLFDVLKGTKIFTMVQHQKSSIKFYEFTFDCTKALTAGDDGTLCFWDLLHHRQIRHFHLHEKEYSLRSFTLSPDSEYLLSMDSVDLLKLWYVGDIVNNEPLCILLNRDIHTDNYCCEFSPVVHVTDDFFLKLKYTIVTCGAGGLIKIWDLIIKRNQKVKKYSEHFKCRLISINVLNHDDFDIISVRFNSMGNFIVTTGLDNAVKLWEVRTGKCLKTFHEHTSFVISAAFSKDSALLITGSTNSYLIIWDLSQSLTLDSQLTTPCYVSHHCTHIKLKDYCIESAETNNLQKLEFTLLQKLNSSSIVNSVRFQSKDVLAVAGGEKTVALWEKRSDILMYEIKKKLKKYKYSIDCMDISPCGNKIIFCSIDGLFILWDLDINMTCEMKGPSSRIGSLKSCKFLPDSKFFGAAGDDQEVYLWDTTGLGFVKILQKHENAITSLTFTPDSKYLVSGCSGGHIKLQHLEQEKCSYRINNAHDLGVTCCDFSSATIHKEECTEIYLTAPKQNCARIYLLATSGKDSRIKLWGVGYSEIFLLTVFSGHGATVNYVTFSPSQPFIFASCSSDTTVRIWHTRTKQCLQVLNFHKSAVTSCSFSIDSTLLATGSLDKTVLIFNLTEQLCLEPKELSLNNSNKLLEKRNTSVNVSETEDQKQLKLQISSKTKEALNFSFILQNKKIVPHMFLCPITHEIMNDPVISSDGFVYEKAALEEWFLSKKFISPITKESLKSTKFLKYSALKINIHKFLQENKK